MILGDFPPNSNETFFKLLVAALFEIIRPTCEKKHSYDAAGQYNNIHQITI